MRYFEFKCHDFKNVRFCIGAKNYSDAKKQAEKTFESVYCIGVLHPYTVKQLHIDTIQIFYSDKKKLYPQHIEVRI